MERVFADVWNLHMLPTMKEQIPIFVLVILVIGILIWRRPALGMLIGGLSLTIWVAKILLEDIGMGRSGAPGAMLVFMILALLFNGFLLFRQMTS